jgi:hypothetical protein
MRHIALEMCAQSVCFKIHLPFTSIENVTKCVPYYFVGDDIFPLKPNLIKPYPGRGLTRERRICNYRISRARCCIENTFGIVSSKWRLMRTAVIASEDNSVRYFKAICCLHNFLRCEQDGRYFCVDTDIDDDDNMIALLDEMPTLLQQVHTMRADNDNHPAISATRNRDLLCDFVNSVGSVYWQ